MAIKHPISISPRCSALLFLLSYSFTQVLAGELVARDREAQGMGWFGNEIYPDWAANPVSVTGVETYFTAPEVPTVSARIPEGATMTIMTISDPMPTDGSDPQPVAPLPATQAASQPSVQPIIQGPSASSVQPAPVSSPPATSSARVLPSVTSSPKPVSSGSGPKPSLLPSANGPKPPAVGSKGGVSPDSAPLANSAGLGDSAQASQFNVGSTIGAIIGIVLATFVAFVAIFFYTMARRRNGHARLEDPEEVAPIPPSFRPYVANGSSLSLGESPPPPMMRVVNPFLDPPRAPPLPPLPNSPPPNTPGLAVTTKGARESATYLASPTITYAPSMADQRPVSNLPQPAFDTGTSIVNVEQVSPLNDLPANLGRLNRWLEENRRRSRMTASSSASISGDARAAHP